MNRIPTKDEAEKILYEVGCSKRVIEHSKAVTSLAVKIAEEIAKKGVNVNLKLVEAGALLHDLYKPAVYRVRAEGGYEISPLGSRLDH